MAISGRGRLNRQRPCVIILGRCALAPGDPIHQCGKRRSNGVRQLEVEVHTQWQKVGEIIFA